MLPARYRMTRSTDFGATVSRGVRAAQPDLVVHALRPSTTPTTGRGSVWSSPNPSARRCSGTGCPGGCGMWPAPCSTISTRRPGGDPGASEQPACDLGPTGAGTARRRCDAPGRSSGARPMKRPSGRPRARRDLRDPAVPPHGLPAAAAVMPVHPDLQSVRGRRADRVRPRARRLVGDGAAGQVRPVASGRMGPDTGARAAHVRTASEQHRSRRRSTARAESDSRV